ncbi:MAG: NAD(P)H-dependent oxidoreductase [Bacillota bacterium]|nr:NAD(P)H-dependent oxidoreductase [Bacillota bacterium]
MRQERILFINACPRPNSRSYALAQFVLSQLSGEVEEVQLFKEKDLHPLDYPALEERERCVQAGDFSSEYFRWAKQFSAADCLVVAAPYWDLFFPSILRVYLEAVSVSGLTFRYGENGQVESLCKAKQLIYVTTSGGFIGEMNYGYDYLKALCQTMFCIPYACCFSAEGLDIYGADEAAILSTARERILQGMVELQERRQS